MKRTFILACPFLWVIVHACSTGPLPDFPRAGVDLLAQLPLSSIGGGSGNDLWGWSDPMTGKEYALMGRTNGTAFIDISDPKNPVYLGNLPTQTHSSTWRDIKVFADHAFVVADDAGAHGMQIFDLTQLRGVTDPPVTFSNTAHYAGFGSSHNLAINEDTGFAYAVGSGTCSGGLHIVDIRDPAQPAAAGCHRADGSMHDAQCVTYHGPDADYRDQEICFTANISSNTMGIVDVSDKGATVTLSRTRYSGAQIPHQAWLTEDHAFVLFGDEGDEESTGRRTRTYIFDVSDLENPVLTGSHDGDFQAIDHNQYVRDGFLYQANYTIGLRILDLADVADGSLSEVAFFDTYPGSNRRAFEGAWSVYPFFDSCTVIVSDIERGLFVLRPSAHCVPLPPPLIEPGVR